MTLSQMSGAFRNPYSGVRNWSVGTVPVDRSMLLTFGPSVNVSLTVFRSRTKSGLKTQALAPTGNLDFGELAARQFSKRYGLAKQSELMTSLCDLGTER